MLVWAAALQGFITLICADQPRLGHGGIQWWRLPLKSLVLLGITAGAVLLGMAVPVLMRMSEGWLFPGHVMRSLVVQPGSFSSHCLVVFFGLSLFYRLAPRRPTRFAEVGRRLVRPTILLRAGGKPVCHLSEGLRHVERGLRGFEGVMALAAVDLSFRMRFYLRSLPVRRPGRSAR